MFGKTPSPKDQLTQFFMCLSTLEQHTSTLFRMLLEKVQGPASAKTKLRKITENTEKHVTALKSIAKSISNSEVKEKECIRKLSFICKTIKEISTEIAAKEKLTQGELLSVLARLESSSGEEKFMLIQAKTFQLMSKELSRLYGVNFENFQETLDSIVDDEMNNGQLLREIRETLELATAKSDKSPTIKFQNPDAWSHSLPATEYE